MEFICQGNPNYFLCQCLCRGFIFHCYYSTTRDYKWKTIIVSFHIVKNCICVVNIHTNRLIITCVVRCHIYAYLCEEVPRAGGGKEGFPSVCGYATISSYIACTPLCRSMRASDRLHFLFVLFILRDRLTEILKQSGVYVYMEI